MRSRTHVFRMHHGAIHEVPIDQWVRFVDGHLPMPCDPAGELRVVFMTLTTEADGPRFCPGIEGAIYATDMHGYLQKDRVFPSVRQDPMEDRSGRVVDARQRFVVKRARSRYRWVPDPELCERLLIRVLGVPGEDGVSPS